MTNPPKSEENMNKELKKGSKITDNLYKAVVDYIKYKKGTVIVVGGIAIMQEPDALKYNYSLLIRITGKKPVFKKIKP